jgi:hypothetical protein
MHRPTVPLGGILILAHTAKITHLLLITVHAIILFLDKLFLYKLTLLLILLGRFHASEIIHVLGIHLQLVLGVLERYSATQESRVLSNTSLLDLMLGLLSLIVIL